MGFGAPTRLAPRAEDSDMKDLQGQASTPTRISFVLIVAITIALLGALVFFSILLQTGS